MKLLAVTVLVLVSCNAQAQEWTRTDTAMLTGALGLLAVDWGQTRDLVRQQEPRIFMAGSGSPPREVHEKNPFLGETPSKREVDRYFLLAMAGTAGLSYVLPPTYRRWFLGGVIVVETAVVLRNHELGLRVRF
jgi:hypothetical protein